MTSPSPNLSLVDTDPAELPVDAVVIGLHSRGGQAEPGDGGYPGTLLLATGAESLAAAFDGKLTESLALLGATGSLGEVVKLVTFGTVTAPLVVAVGLGKEPTGAAPEPETLRRAAGAAIRALAGCERVALTLPLPDDEDASAALRAVAEGALLGGYRFAGYKTRPQPTLRPPVESVAVHVPDAADATARADIERSRVVARAVIACRDWVNTTPDALRPPAFADAVAEAARAVGLTVQVLDEQELLAGGYGGIVAVGQGSQAPPRLVKLSYEPAGDQGPGGGRRVALVGKGVTFDSGGLSIKPAQGMWEMKADMAGAAAVAAAMLAVAQLRPSVAVHAYLPMAENMPSGTAYRPGDVVTMYNGKRVEILNTDAEGRLLLGDAMARACEDGCDYLIETSTLTGGQVVALGKSVAGVMGTAQLCERVRRAGDAVGEPAWPMPLPEDVRTGMDSDIADICQTNAAMDRAGHMLQGGVFLREFVADDVPWAHIDVAGPALHGGQPTGYLTKGATGVPVRTLLWLVEDIAAQG